MTDQATSSQTSGLRLTDRGIALVLGVFAVLMILAGVAVATTFWQVTGPTSIYAAR